MERIALITGADRGLGLALAAGLLAKQWRVIAGQFMPDWPELDDLASHHPDLLTILPLDVSLRRSTQHAARSMRRRVDHIDLLINNAGINTSILDHNIRNEQDYGEMHRMYDINALGPLRVVECFRPLIDKSEMKRLCFVSSEAGSIERAYRQGWHGYCMSKAALNMGVKLLFNHLRPEGYTFRLYHPGWIRSYIGGSKGTQAPLEPEEAAVPALAHFLEDPVDPSSEDRLVMKGLKGEEWPW